MGIIMSEAYNKITVLKNLEAIKKVPGMYVGNCENGDALFNIFREVLDNSIDEFMNNFGDKVTVTILSNGGISVADSGRGIPVSYDKIEKKSSLELALTQLHAGSKFNKESYKISSGLHGVGVCATNALSLEFKATVWRDGNEYSMAFERGKKVQDLTEKPCRGKRTGTLISFIPDPQIFKNVTTYDPEKIKIKLRELSFLCHGLTIEFIDEINNTSEIYPGETNISDFVRYLAKSTALISDPIIVSSNSDSISMDIALQWLEGSSEDEVCKCYTNNVYNPDGGTHLAGFRSSLTRTVNSYIDASDLPKTMKLSLSGDDIREGLISIVSVKLSDPKFSSQTKDKLVSDDARSAVESVMSSEFLRYLEQNPVIAKKIVTRCITAYKAREAARKAKEAVRKTDLKGCVGFLPGKLADCHGRDPDLCELFLVEGQSAGGCWISSTKSILCDGRELDFIELEREEKAGKQNFCFTIKNNDVCAVPIKNVRKTKENAKVIKIVLSNGKEEVCTPDHPLMLANGSYIPAKDSLNMGLMSFYPFRHKVIEIIELEEPMDVYDLEVPETHNFALAAGIFVHNSAKQGRNREFQAILPLRGKVLNIERAEYKKMMDNEELMNLITAVGVGIGKQIDLSKLRYGKIIICTDSDVDGSHIRTLLLTFFYRQLPQLIETGHIYIAQPPLYRLEYRNNPYYLKDDNALRAFIKEKKLDNSSMKLQRYKGLGELAALQLWETTMNPETRSLLQVKIDSYLEADKMFNILMGSQVDMRRDFIMANSELLKNLDT